MNDLIFWGTDYQAFLKEASEKSPKLVGINVLKKEYRIFFDKTLIKTNAQGEFMFLVRASDDEVGHFARCQTIENLGAYASVFASPSKREIYDRIYPNAPYDVIDRNGDTITITPPERFGAFGS